MEFTSQICTTKEQSERLLALGLKKETADMMYYKTSYGEFIGVKDEDYIEHLDFPAWSLHRLIEIFKSGINISEYIVCGNAYDEIVDDIEYEIKIGRFNKEYLKG